MNSSKYYKTCKQCRYKPKETKVRVCKVDLLAERCRRDILKGMKDNWKEVTMSDLATKFGIQIHHIQYWVKKQSK